MSTVLWFLLGYWLQRAGLVSTAEACLRSASEGTDFFAAKAAQRLSKHLIDQGQFAAAERVCRRAIARTPRHARAWCLLGAVQRHQGQMEAAREAYAKALSLDPDFAAAHGNLGEWFLARGEASAAMAHIKRALDLDPNQVESLNNRVAALYELGQFAEAEAAARRALERHPRQAQLYVNLGNVLFHTGKARPAVKAFRRALECDPACPEAHLALSTLLGESFRLAEVLDFVTREIAAKGESVQRMAWLAAAQHAKGDLFAAEATCAKILDRQPTNITALVTLSGCLSTRGRHAEAIEHLERALAVNPQMSAMQSNIGFNSTYMTELSRTEVYARHAPMQALFEKNIAAQSAATFSHATHDRDPERRLRIAYVSGDFCRHPVGYLFRDVMEQHDSTAFEVHCYSMMRGEDEITTAIRAKAAYWHDVLLDSDAEVAQKIFADDIDILIDLSGHTAYNRLPAFVLRPAPVQVTWIGYFHSTGLDCLDYFITDPHTSPPGCGQLFSETPIWLPHSRFCYAPPAYATEVAPPPSLANGHITFGCFNRIEKLVPSVIALWADLLKALPDSRLVLKAGALRDEGIQADLRQRFTAHGIDEVRLDIRPASHHPVMLAEYGEIDIALDPFPFNGGMTTLEALWMGVPIVTLNGDAVVSRQTVSALTNLGLPELAFANPIDWLAGVLALARDPERLTRLRREIRPRMAASPICQPAAFTRDLEQLYRRMWQAWCRGERLANPL